MVGRQRIAINWTAATAVWCVCVCVCVCAGVCVHACACVSACVRTCMRAFVTACVRAYVGACLRACVCVRACVRDVFAIYDNNILSRLIIIIIKIIILYFIQIRHTDDFPSTVTQLVQIIRTCKFIETIN